MPRAPLPSDSMSPVKVGDVVAGKYRVERVLAVGGMGVVVEANHQQLDEKVAIKFLQPEALQNQEAVERFATEARAASRIKSEHVARVLDVGEIDGGGPYMVMEYLDGEDLAARLERVQCLSAGESVDIILQAAEAVAEAHANGIVHRDLKPANLFLAARPDGMLCVKVLDFGISKIDRRFTKATNLELTAADAVLGSPLYMAPEQMRAAREADARSDVWALGAILYEMIVGKPAFEAPTEHEICRRIFNEEPAPIGDLRPAVSLDLERAVRGALEKELGKRFKTIADFANAVGPHGARSARGSVERIHAVLNRAGIKTGPLTTSVDAVVRVPLPVREVSSTAAVTQLARRTTPAAWGDAPTRQKRGSPVLWGLGIGSVGAALVTWYLATSYAVDESRNAGKPSPSLLLAASARAAAARPSVAATSAAPTATSAPAASAHAAASAPAAEAPAPTSADEEADDATAQHKKKPSGAAAGAPPRPGATAAARPTANAAPPPKPTTAPNPGSLFDEQK